MPHITIEYTANLRHVDEPWVLLQVNKALLGLGIFMDYDIKTRIHRLLSYQMGVHTAEDGEHGFVSATIDLLSGREFSTLEHVGNVLLKVLERTCLEPGGPQTQISVQVREMRSDLYFKSVSKR